MIVEDRYEQVMVCDDVEVLKASEEYVALGYRPCYCQELQFNDGILRLSIREKS